MTTVFDVVRSSADVLRKAGVDTPEHDAKLLLAEALHVDLRDVDKAMLMGDDTERLAGKNDAESALERFRAMLDRRARREPLQHITGHAPFRYLDLKVGPGVFVPRPETELVVQEGIDWTTSHGMYSARVVDLCAGSGAIGLSFAMEVPGSEVWAVEKSATAAEWTRRNLDETVRRHPNIAGNYHLEISDATQMPTLNQLDGTIDIVLTNPPYVPLADIGTLIPERIIARAAKLLRADGLMVMEHDITQGERLAAFARTCGFVDVTVHNDYTGRPRYLTAEKQPAQ